MYACVRETMHTLIRGFIQDFCQRGEIIASGNVGGLETCSPGTSETASETTFTNKSITIVGNFQGTHSQSGGGLHPPNKSLLI